MRTSVASLLLALSLTRTAAAQGTGAQAGDAGDLAAQAAALVGEHRYAEACPKLAESQRLAPSVDTVIALAECYEGDGRLASAYLSYGAAAELAAQRADPREASARQHRAELEPRLSRLTIDVPEGSRVPGLKLSRDTVELGPESFGVPLPVDGGVHRVLAVAPGYETWAREGYVDNERASVRFEVPPLVQLRTAGAPPPSAPAPSVRTDEPGSAQRTIGYVAIGAGAVGLLAGVAFALQRQGYLDDRAQICPDDVCPNGELEKSQAEVDALTDKARGATTRMAVSFALGGVGVAAGVALLLTVPEPGPRTALRVLPVVGRDFGGLSVRGGF